MKIQMAHLNKLDNLAKQQSFKIQLQKNSPTFLCFSQFCGSFHCLNFGKFCDTAPLSIPPAKSFHYFLFHLLFLPPFPSVCFLPHGSAFSIKHPSATSPFFTPMFFDYHIELHFKDFLAVK